MSINELQTRRLVGKVALVTGGATGIGESIVYFRHKLCTHLECHCDGLISPMQQNMLNKRRYLREDNGMHQKSGSPLPTLGCRTYGYLLSQYWANDPVVRELLHTRKGSIGKWQRCDYEMPYISDLQGNSLRYHVNLSARGLPSLIYIGDHDMLIPFLATQAWIRSLNYSIELLY